LHTLGFRRRAIKVKKGRANPRRDHWEHTDFDFYIVRVDIDLTGEGAKSHAGRIRPATTGALPRAMSALILERLLLKRKSMPDKIQ
jgi:hypothetical protein